MVNYDKIDEQTLRQLFLTRMSDLKALTGQDMINAEADVGLILKALNATVEERENSEKLASQRTTTTTSNPSQQANAQLRELKSAVDECPQFGAGKNLDLFLSNLSNVYLVYSKHNSPDIEKLLEESFIRAAKNRLSNDFLTRLNNSGEKISDFEQFKTYMIENHETSTSVFQRLDTLWSLQPKNAESFIDFSARLENKCHEVNLSIKAKFKKQFPDRQMTVDDYGKVITGQILVQAIQSSNRKDCYKFIASDLDSCWSANQIATKAASICAKLKQDNGGEPIVAGFAGTVSNGNKFGGGETKKRTRAKPDPSKPCFGWLEGECKRGTTCGYEHDPAKRGIGRMKKENEKTSMLALASFHH